MEEIIFQYTFCAQVHPSSFQPESDNGCFSSSTLLARSTRFHGKTLRSAICSHSMTFFCVSRRSLS